MSVPQSAEGRSWAAFAVEGPYYVAMEWKRGERCPTVQQHGEMARSARLAFAQARQQGAALDGMTFVCSDRRTGESRFFLMVHRDRQDWSPGWGFNRYDV